MGVTLFSSAKWEVNAKDLSSYVTDITPNYASEMLDQTAMGAGTRGMKGGLKNWSFDVTYLYDCSTGGPEAVLWSLVGTTVCVEYRDVNTCGGASNPILSGVGTLENLNRGGTVGGLLKATSRVVAFSDLTRASAS